MKAQVVIIAAAIVVTQGILGPDSDPVRVSVHNTAPKVKNSSSSLSIRVWINKKIKPKPRPRPRPRSRSRSSSGHNSGRISKPKCKSNRGSHQNSDE